MLGNCIGRCPDEAYLEQGRKAQCNPGCHESMDNIPVRDVIRGLPYGNSSSGASIRIDMNVSGHVIPDCAASGSIRATTRAMLAAKGCPALGDSFWNVKACLHRQSELCHSTCNINEEI